MYCPKICLFFKFFFIFCFIFEFVIAGSQQCHSCTTYCKTLPNGKLDPETCDCETTDSCVGDQCFTKIELFHEEFTAIIQVIFFTVIGLKNVLERMCIGFTNWFGRMSLCGSSRIHSLLLFR